ncbi:MAG: hypothetical protein JWM62_1200 [Frankiales bacterium]|nr:hypothetical protein [Frankiales bacterium]
MRRPWGLTSGSPGHRIRTTAGVAAGLASVALIGGCTDTTDSRAAPAPAAAAELGTASADGLTVSGGWAAADNGRGTTSASPPMTAAYVTIASSAEHDDALVGAQTDAAAEVQIHTSVLSPDGTSSTMRQVPDLAVPAGGSVTMEPGGEHLMLLDLAHRLRPGATIAVELHFADGTRLVVELPVLDRIDRPHSGHS